MILLFSLGAFIAGLWAGQVWGEHRAGYYKKHLVNVLREADKVNNTNKELLKAIKNNPIKSVKENNHNLEEAVV